MRKSYLVQERVLDIHELQCRWFARLQLKMLQFYQYLRGVKCVRTNYESGEKMLTRLSLSDNIASSNAWNDSALLNSRWLLETISVNSSQKFFLQAHSIEIIDDFIPVRLDDSTYFHACWSIVRF